MSEVSADRFDIEDLKKGTFFIETTLNIYSRRLVDEPVPGSGIIVPKRHARTVFDLTDEEWADTMMLLKQVRAYLDQEFQPDGYTLGWNCYQAAGQKIKHAHLHIVPRFADEPRTGLGIRFWVRENNARPVPLAPGSGRGCLGFEDNGK